MMLILTIVMVSTVSWGIFRYVSERGGSALFWAGLTAGGYAIIELSVCRWLDVKPTEYFLTYFPMSGVIWLGLVGGIVRIVFRKRVVRFGT